MKREQAKQRIASAERTLTCCLMLHLTAGMQAHVTAVTSAAPLSAR
jgi:hypothetical protein